MSSDSPGVLVLPPVLYVLGVAVSLGLHALAPSQIAPRAIANGFGLLLLIAGIALGTWARDHLKRHGTDVDPRKPTTALVTTGPYRFTRNPLYLRVTFLYLAVALFVNDLWFLPVLVVVLAVLHFGVIRREERYLEAKFGDSYREYRARVRRWM